MHRSIHIIITLGLISLLSGCMTSTRFTTKPEGAKLYINGDFMGETPVTYNDKRSLPSRLHIQIKKAGYRDLDFYLDKSFDYTGIVFLNPYTFLAFPWLASGLDSKYSINLRSLKISKEASSDPPAKEDDIDTIELTP